MYDYSTRAAIRNILHSFDNDSHQDVNDDDTEHGVESTSSLSLEQIYAHINNRLVIWSKQLTKTLDEGKAERSVEDFPGPGMGYSKKHLLVVSCALKSRSHSSNNGNAIGVINGHAHHHSNHHLQSQSNVPTAIPSRYPPPLCKDNGEDDGNMLEGEDEESSIQESVPYKPSPSGKTAKSKRKTKK